MSKQKMMGRSGSTMWVGGLILELSQKMVGIGKPISFYCVKMGTYTKRSMMFCLFGKKAIISLFREHKKEIKRQTRNKVINPD